jgi:hypothetical protein
MNNVGLLEARGDTDWDRESLNMSVNTPVSWSAHATRSIHVLLIRKPGVLIGVFLLQF